MYFFPMCCRAFWQQQGMKTPLNTYYTFLFFLHSFQLYRSHLSKPLGCQTRAKELHLIYSVSQENIPI
ncbi:hypothetical protein FKM82_010253 [Ascaphus truei]